MSEFAGQEIVAFGRKGSLEGDARLIAGQTPSGGAAPLAVEADGSVKTSPAASASTTAATFAGFVKTVAASGTPEALGSGLVESVAIRPNKARGTANTGNVYIQSAATNDLAGGWELTPTASPIVITAPAGKKIDLASIFIDVATNGDGVVAMTLN